MATWDDVARLALALPEATEDPSHAATRSWRVRDKAFAWERPLRRADVAELGDAAPSGPVLAVRVPDIGARAALVADSPSVYFATAHFAGYPAVLVWLDEIGVDELAEVLDEAWACRAPRRLVAEHRAGR
ncbi:MmcQ/YjbR family DNA-binding protein [Modestobacter versicolor]|uniref:MmcQ/YjbR family DNA-binding protein n=1 Tax=Modestobacter versicolor TaxID=429133 RepID=A0A323V474_9ACTN|nr:MmcQ/YjbR family DNA-binding protein [Modestobacter versicolor]MBB3676456.1 hypothetical protein [Modestobacter versicolor]PZA19542.1 MmcQ/YjbR family DNA-binding protein [Modestobacter versicolor]